MEKSFKRFVTLFKKGFTGIPDFEFDFIETEALANEEFQDTVDRLTKEFNELVDISEKLNDVNELEIGDIVNG